MNTDKTSIRFPLHDLNRLLLSSDGEDIPSAHFSENTSEAVAAGAILDHLKNPPEGGVQASFILKNLTKRAFLERGEAVRFIAAWCDCSSIKKQWAQWQNTSNREEIKLRLEIIKYFGSLNQGLIDFLFFYFRSSDPAVYQTAAETAGYLYEAVPELTAKIDQYVTYNSQTILSVVHLQNARSLRRIIIVQAAMYARKPVKERAGFTERLLAENLNDPLQLKTSDLDAALLALYIVLIPDNVSSDSLDKISNFFDQLIELPTNSFSRVTIRMLGYIWHELPQTPEKRLLTGEKIHDKLSEEFYRAQNTSLRYAALTKLDESARITALLPPEECDLFFNKFEKYTSKYPIVFIRLITWMRREKNLIPVRYPARERIIPGSVFDSAIAYERSSSLYWPGNHSLHFEEDTRRKILEGLLAEISNPKKWYLNDFGTRALKAFFLLDYSAYLSLQPGEINAFLPGKNPSDDGAAAHFYADEGQAGRLTAHILLQLNAAENEHIDIFLEGRTLHQLSSAELLINFLFPGQSWDVYSVLADVFEHILRNRLIKEPRFNVVHFLHQLSVRKPDVKFFNLLAGICSNRQYFNYHNEEVPVSDAVQTIAGQKQDEEKFTPPLLHGLKKHLDTIRCYSDLQDKIHHLARVLFPAISDKPEELSEQGLAEVILYLNHDSHYLLQSGMPAYSAEKSGQMRDKLKESALNLTNHLHGIFPVSFYETVKVNDNILKATEDLQELEDHITPYLPAYEANFFKEVLGNIQYNLNEWQSAFNHLGDNRKEVEVKPHDPDLRESFLQEIIAIKLDAFRSKLLEIFIHTLQQNFRKEVAIDKPSNKPAWIHEFDFLKWAADRKVTAILPEQNREEWIKNLTSSWNYLAEEAVSDKFEKRARILLDEPILKPVRMHPNCRDNLMMLRKWFFDLLSPRYALKTRQNIESAGKTSVFTGIFSELADFAKHYMFMWVAILIGAILMLDFGDAFMAMAEIQDIPGIIATSLMGVLGAYLYLYFTLDQRTAHAPEDNKIRNISEQMVRSGIFLGFCLIFTLAVTSFFWYLLSGTDEVIHGDGAWLHIIVWAGFALFVGVFFSLIAKRN